MQSAEEFAAMLDRCAHTAEGMGERLTDTYRIADLIRARDAEVRADERAQVVTGFTEQRTTFWEHDEGTARLRRPGPGIPYRRLVGPWEPVADEGGAS